MSEKKPDKFKLTTPPFPGSYVNLASPRQVEDGDPYFGLNIVLPKTSPFWKEVDRLTPLAAIEKFGEVPDGLSLTRKDGDSARAKDKNPTWAGCFSQPCNKKQKQGRPDVIDLTGRALLDPAELYSGAIYVVSLRVAAYKFGSVKKGVSLFLQNVVKIEDGDRIGGNRSTAEDDFADIIADLNPDPCS